MKTRVGIVALIAGLATATACNDDFLTETPRDFVSPETFYRNEGDALAAVNAAYATFIVLPSPFSSDQYLGRNFWMVAEYPTEVVTSRLSATNERSRVDNYHTQFNSSHPYIEGIWAAAYAGINRANSVIARVPAVPMNATRRDQIVAEAKFLRALHYYFLAGLFGGVPLKLEETREIGAPLTPRATAAQTWAQIEKDLTEAAAVLPVSWGTADYGRATRGAALTLLGKANLHSAQTTGASTDFQDALDAFNSVMGLNVYSLDPNYASLFTGANERSPEIIFSIQNIAQPGLGGRITEWFSPITNPPIYAAGAQNQFQAERRFYDSYNARDTLRKNGTWLTSFFNPGANKTVTWTWTSGIQSATNYGSTGPVPRKYLDLDAPDGNMEEPDVILFRYADVLLSAAEAINEISGPTAEAYTLVNRVLARAMPATATLPVVTLTPGLTKEQFRDSLFLQRRYELALEMHGIFDNRRNWAWSSARLEASMDSISQRNATPFTSSTTKFDARVPQGRGGKLPEKWKLYPIPAHACELNPLLVQNPGWDDGICKPSTGTTTP